MDANFEKVQAKSRHLARKIRASSLPPQAANLAYNSVALPQLQYSLLMTTYSAQELEKIQKPLTRAFLPRMGFNSGMKRAVVFGPRKYGGYQMGNVDTNRGHDQIKYILGHIRMQDPLGLMMEAVLAQTQLFSGSGTHILEDPSQILNYVPVTWVTTVATFLAKIKSTIISKHAWKPTFQRTNDRFLMDDFRTHTQSKTQLSRLNACRLFLKVTTLADICDATGQYIERDKFDGTSEPAHSKYVWPKQVYPTIRMWKLWKSMLYKCYTNERPTLEITTHLAEWIPANLSTFWPSLFNHRSQTLHIEDPT